jgi:hypothetical protein
LWRDEWVDAAWAEPGTRKIKARGGEARFDRGITRRRFLFALTPCVDYSFRNESAAVRAKTFSRTGFDRCADARP